MATGYRSERVLPPGLTATDMDRAVEAFVEALGAAAVVTSEEDLREFRDPYAYIGWDDNTASAVVMPTTVEQVQAVVRIANQHRIPLWTFGQGRNNTYGGPAPRVRGSVLVNLRGMNRVLEVSGELAYAVVEPGVRFFDLHDHIREGGFRLWPSIPDIGWGSVVGNTLEYGRGYTLHGDHAASVCGMEVVLPDGELMRTGMGALPGGKTWHAYKWGFGPSVDGLFMQSNLGIVTKLGVWLMPEPDVYLSCFAKFADDATVEPVVEVLRELLLDGTIRNYPLLAQGVGVGEQEGRVGEDGRWAMRFALYGRSEVVEAQFRVASAAFTSIPGVEVERRPYAGSDLSGVTMHDDKVQCGIPGMELMDRFMEPFGEHTGHLHFSPVSPNTGAEVIKVIALMKSLYGRHGIPYVAGLIVSPRSVLHISTTFYDTRDEAQTSRAYDAYADLVRGMAAGGYGVYRTNIQNMDVVADTYGFNNHALRRFTETIKDAIDPNGVLSPGKQGIWPRRLRPDRDVASPNGPQA